MAPAAPAVAEQPSETLVNKINGFVNEYISEKDKKEALLVRFCLVLFSFVLYCCVSCG